MERPWSDDEKRAVARGLLLAESVREIAGKLDRHYGGVCKIITRLRHNGRLAALMEAEWAKIKPEQFDGPNVARFFRPVADNVTLPESNQCSFPFGEMHETGLAYCPAPKLAGMSYCLAHTLRSTGPRDRPRLIERLVVTHGVNFEFAATIASSLPKETAPPAEKDGAVGSTREAGRIAGTTADHNTRARTR